MRAASCHSGPRSSPKSPCSLPPRAGSLAKQHSWSLCSEPAWTCLSGQRPPRGRLAETRALAGNSVPAPAALGAFADCQCGQLTNSPPRPRALQNQEAPAGPPHPERTPVHQAGWAPHRRARWAWRDPGIRDEGASTASSTTR